MKLFASLSKKALVSILVVLLPILITFLIGYRLNKAHLERFVENNLIEEGIVAVGVREMLIGASIGFIAVAGLIGMLLIVFHRKVVVPLRRISTAADDIGQERFDISLPVQSDDEIGALAESFNNMAKKIEEKNREVNRLSAAFEHSVNVLFITNINGVIEYVNPMFETVTGWSKEEAIGKTPAILSSGETTRAEYEELWKTITAGKTWRGTFKNKRKDGRPYWGNGVITPIKDERGKVTHFLAVQEDITEKKMADERVQYLVTRDNFTGLLNRTRFIEVVSEWIYNHQNVHQNGALLLVNVDGFKDINDTFGHGIGDELIRYVAKLLEDTLVGADIPPDNRTDGAILGRLGGDEFAVFLPDVDTNMGMETAERIRKSIEEFRLPALAIQLTVSIGVVSYPEHGKSSKELFTKVDAALYHAKTSGRNRCHLYRPEDRDMENIRSRIHQKQRIIKALGEGRFLPWFQPILYLKDNRVHHYEALARMQDEGGKILFPGEFINTAERFGMIGAIDKIITEKSMRLQAEMGRKGKDFSFAMNLSGKNLGDEELLTFLQSTIKETGADPEHLMFEITETAAVQDLDKAVKFITALKAMGCKFSLDDFGVGFTSFVYLREMNVDYIKIDGSFVKRLHENPDDQLIVKAIAGVAKGMGIKTIAEFVEKEETLKLLREFGVDYAQGYLIGKPGPELMK
ncbi:MAG: EAL domain-containing protein [Deltaproteobacteria bacterium]